jgi:hypothetical protein
MAWLRAFVLTQAIEVPLAMACLRGRPRARTAVVAALATSVSHPLLCFVLLPGLPGPFVGRVLAGEAVVIALEAVVYARGLRLGAAHALAASAFLNAASYLIGLGFFNGPA